MSRNVEQSQGVYIGLQESSVHHVYGEIEMGVESKPCKQHDMNERLMLVHQIETSRDAYIVMMHIFTEIYTNMKTHCYIQSLCFYENIQNYIK